MLGALLRAGFKKLWSRSEVESSFCSDHAMTSFPEDKLNCKSYSDTWIANHYLSYIGPNDVVNRFKQDWIASFNFVDT